MQEAWLVILGWIVVGCAMGVLVWCWMGCRKPERGDQ